MVTVAATATACASASHRAYYNDPTIEIHNGGAASVELHVIQGVSVLGDTIGYSLGTLFSGQTACFELQSTTTQQWVKVKSVDGAFLTPSFNATSRQAWRLDLRGNPRTDPLALQPADEKCRPGERPSSG